MHGRGPLVLFVGQRLDRLIPPTNDLDPNQPHPHVRLLAFVERPVRPVPAPRRSLR